MEDQQSRTPADRHTNLVRAVQGGAVGMDTTTARSILASLIPVLRGQLVQDLTGVCGRPAGETCPDDCVCRVAAFVARMGIPARPA